MAQRPLFVPSRSPFKLVEEINVTMKWHPGFAASQKQKNVVELQRAAAELGYAPTLEVSTKSNERLGERLSAFNLRVKLGSKDVSLEAAFQGSKVFGDAGPFVDLYDVDPRSARRDPRLKCSGRLTGFRLLEITFPLLPISAFYDWLYLNAIFPHREWLARLSRFEGFSDIEFNPAHSVNCQARSCALFVSLESKGMLDEAISSPERFIHVLQSFSYMLALPSEKLGELSRSESQSSMEYR